MNHEKDGSLGERIPEQLKKLGGLLQAKPHGKPAAASNASENPDTIGRVEPGEGEERPPTGPLLEFLVDLNRLLEGGNLARVGNMGCLQFQDSWVDQGPTGGFQPEAPECPGAGGGLLDKG
jgi:hypothetical protein